MKLQCLTGFVLALFAFHSHGLAARPHQESPARFFAAVEQGDVTGAIELLHPAAAEEVDAPVLEAWIRRVNKNLGQIEEIETVSRHSTSRLSGELIEHDLRVTFEHGTAYASLRLLDGQIVSFEVQSDALRNWFNGPTRIDPYSEYAESFMRSFLAGEAVASHEMLHEELRKVVTFDKLEEMIDQVCANSGPVVQLSLREQRFSLDGPAPALFLTFDVECEQASGECELEFQFTGMKGHLLGFYFR